MNHLTSTAREITVRVKGLEQDLRNRHNAGESAREKLNDYQLAFDVRELAEVVTQLAERVDGLTQASLPVSNGHTAHAQPAQEDLAILPDPDPVRTRLLELLYIGQEYGPDDEGEDALTLLNRYAEHTEKRNRQLAGTLRDVLAAVYPEKAGKPWRATDPDVSGLADEVKALAGRAVHGDGGLAHIRVMLQGTDVWDEDDTSAGMVARLIDQHRDLTGLVKDVRTALHPAWTDAPWDVDAVDVRNLPDEVKNLADNARELDGRIRKAMLELNPPPF
jgi:hypothetical protein